MRNVLYKVINKVKTQYYVNLLKKSRNMWKTVRNLNTTEKGSIPVSVIVNNKLVSSPSKLAVAFCGHFYNKIIKIRQNFSKCRMDPIEVLALIIPRVKKEYKLPFITIKEVQNIIFKMKRSNNCGYDGISSRIIKIIPEITSIYLTDAINMTIRTSTFPVCLKIARLLPISKPGLSVDQLTSYRPISNMHIFEKVIEEHMKKHLLEHMESNNIILKEHHGGIARHSTLTAKVLIDYRVGAGVDENKTTAILSTDLSSAFDTVDTCILMRKLV